MLKGSWATWFHMPLQCAHAYEVIVKCVAADALTWLMCRLSIQFSMPVMWKQICLTGTECDFTQYQCKKPLGCLTSSGTLTALYCRYELNSSVLCDQSQGPAQLHC